MNTAKLRNRKDRFSLFFLFFVILCSVVLSFATLFALSNPDIIEGNFGLVIVAEQLAEPPLSFYNWNSPDAYVLQAIANPNHIIFVGDWNNSQIHQIAANFGSGNAVNIKVNTQYYHIALGSIDPPAPTNTKLTWTLIGWIIFAVTAVCIVAIKHRYSRKQL